MDVDMVHRWTQLPVIYSQLSFLVDSSTIPNTCNGIIATYYSTCFLVAQALTHTIVKWDYCRILLQVCFCSAGMQLCPKL